MAGNRRPSFQFYPDDWLSNTKLRRASHELKGIWIDLICLLHDSDEYGVLRWPLADIAKAINTTPRKVQKLLELGVLKGTPKDGSKGTSMDTIGPVIYHQIKTNQDHILLEKTRGPVYFSERMLRDEFIRNLRGKHGIESLKNSNVARPKDTIDPPLDRDIDPPITPDIAPPIGVSPPSPSPSPSPKDNPTTCEKNPEFVPKSFGEWREILVNQFGYPLKALANPNTIELINDWAAQGIPVKVIDQAIQIAEMKLNKRPNTPAYLENIVKDVIKAANSASNKLDSTSSEERYDWKSTWSGIKAKGDELGIDYAKFDSDPAFKAAVFSAAGEPMRDRPKQPTSNRPTHHGPESAAGLVKGLVDQFKGK